MEVRKCAVCRPRHPLFLEHLVDAAAQGLTVAVGAGAGLGRADNLECGDAGGGGERVGVERALMRDLFAFGGLCDLKVEKVEDVLAAGDRTPPADRRRGSWP